MTKYYYNCKEDKKLIEKSFNNLAFLIFGKNNPNRIKVFANYFEKRISQVNIYPQGTVTPYLNSTTPGICRNDNERIIIEMLGYKGARSNQSSWLKHEGTHEFCHSFVDILPEIMSEKPNGIIKNGVLYKNHMGMIKEMNPETGELVGRHYYGKMFNETMMDIISSMAINCFDSDSSTSTVDDILKLNFNNWGNETTSYSIFTSITRLAIASFSNNGFINYQNAIDNGLSIFDGKTKMNNNATYKINDFLYGIIFDFLHIEKEFDKFMGEGSFQTFCKYLDQLFLRSLSDQKLSSKEVKKIMTILPNFLNKKINYYRQNGILDLRSANKIVANFNQIWNSMQQEYASYFTEEDINEIEKKANKF